MGKIQVLLFAVISLCQLISITAGNSVDQSTSKSDECILEIVETMPVDLTYNTSLSFKTTQTHEALLEMINNSKESLKIASFYFTLIAESPFDKDDSAAPGRNIFEAIKSAAARGIKLEVIFDASSSKAMSNIEEMNTFKSLGDVKGLNMTKISGGGIMHSKIMITDDKNIYVGSSNFDWRSYSHVKETGIKFSNCPELAGDLNKVFRTYQFMSQQEKIPDKLPQSLNTNINIDNPFELKIGNSDTKMFISAAPPSFNGEFEWTGRTDDIDALLHVISKARKFINISVMNYSPTIQFAWPKKFWPRIDDALRQAATERRVQVNLLFSNWSHVKPEERMWYKSLDAVQSSALKGGGIKVKLMKVPAFNDFQRKIPYARVKHDKYMVTDNGLYLGTSNWSADYFTSTCGVSFTFIPENIKQQVPKGSLIDNMREYFERDFNSDYSKEISLSEF